MKILLKISFLGTAYKGYQVQKNGLTIQECLTNAAKQVFCADCDIVGCSRTDSGVHANMFCATVSNKGEDSLNTSIPISKIPEAFCFYLPNDISVYDAEWVSDDFHARYDVEYKEYIYRISNRRCRDPFEEGRSHLVHKLLDGADIERMNTAASYYVGKHDFCAFMASGSKVTDTVREVFYAEVKKEGDTVIFRVAADGFLYNMVRIMVGTLLSVADGKIAPEDIEKIIDSRDRRLAGSTAPACGLYLNKVVYRK